jgi:oligopeptide transport system permease protein
MVTVLAFTFIQPYLPGQMDPLEIHTNEWGMPFNNIPPGTDGFILGTNAIGQDLWSRIWSGTRTSLFIGFSVALVEAVVGILVGVLWGYVRKLDFFFTELYNVLDNIPQTLLLILISYVLKPGVSTIIFALCLTGWLGMARFIRNQIIIIRDRDYNLASRCLGVSTGRIIFKNLLPYLVSVITMRMALAIPAAIGNEVFVTYIGIGLPLDTPSLGNLINTGRSLMTMAPLRYQLYFPVIVLAVITISFYIIGNAFADAADPKNHV